MAIFSKKIFQYILLSILAAMIFISLISGCASQEENEIIFSFLYMSDTQADPEIGDYTSFGELLEIAVNHETEPRLLILGGDNINSGSSTEEWDAFWTAAGNNLDDFFVASVAGNHDNDPLLAEKFDLPKIVPGNPTEGFFYTFTENNVFFLMLDSNIMGAGNASDVEWLGNQLSSSVATDADWRIAVLHHPFWTVADIPRDMQRAETMREKFLPLLEEHGVDLILCGHQHVYSRTAPMLSGVGIAAENGIIQIMTASGAKASYSPGEHGYIETIAETPVYLIVEVGTDLLNITAYNDAGEPFDNVQISRRK